MAIGHAVSLAVAWLALSCLAGGPAAFLRGYWAKARGLRARLRLDGYTFWASVFAGAVTWALVTLAAAVLPLPTKLPSAKKSEGIKHSSVRRGKNR
jgi:hypothetical protein